MRKQLLKIFIYNIFLCTWVRLKATHFGDFLSVLRFNVFRKPPSSSKSIRCQKNKSTTHLPVYIFQNKTVTTLSLTTIPDN